MHAGPFTPTTVRERASKGNRKMPSFSDREEKKGDRDRVSLSFLTLSLAKGPWRETFPRITGFDLEPI